MNIFTIRKGKERPIDCKLYYTASCIYSVRKNDFILDNMLQFIGQHAADMYSNEVITPADYDYMHIDIKEWEILKQGLLLPVYVTDHETRRYVYRLEANTDIIHSIVRNFNESTNTPDNMSGFQDIPLEGNLIFTDMNAIINALRKTAMPYTKYIVYHLSGGGSLSHIAENLMLSETPCTVTENIIGRIRKTLRAHWDTAFDFDALNTIIDVKLIDDVVFPYGIKTSTAQKPDNCTSMLWKVHCFIHGGYSTTYSFRVEMYYLNHTAISIGKDLK